jgi:hypothetical protein
MSPSRVAIVGAISFAICGCGVRTQFTPLNPPPVELRALDASDVEVFKKDYGPIRPHVEIGTMEVEQMGANRADYAELHHELRKLAAKHGCQAVRILGGTEERLGIRATCLVYKPEPTKPEPNEPKPTSDPPAAAPAPTDN